MKLFSLIIASLMISSTAFTAQSSLKEKDGRAGFFESRQNKAREIMKENFRSINQIEKKSKIKSGFGFHKKSKEKTQNI